MDTVPRPSSEPVGETAEPSAERRASWSAHALPGASKVLTVCAHPDDESFGLGAILARFSEQGTGVHVLCFTRGEASTLGEAEGPLAELRAGELRAAARVLGVEHVELLSYGDGHLAEAPLDELAALVADAMTDADLVLVFDRGGITGHADHCRATDAALEAADAGHVPVIAWVLPEDVARRLNAEFGTGFVGRQDAEIDLTIEVDRDLQRAAIDCHSSQSTDNPVLRRRLELLGESEHLRWLAGRPSSPPT